MKPSQAEVLLRIAENTYIDGNEVIAEMRRTGELHARRLLDDKEMLERALDINKQDCTRFAQYMPRQETRETQRELGDRSPARAALTQMTQVKKAAE